MTNSTWPRRWRRLNRIHFKIVRNRCIIQHHRVFIIPVLQPTTNFSFLDLAGKEVNEWLKNKEDKKSWSCRGMQNVKIELKPWYLKQDWIIDQEIRMAENHVHLTDQVVPWIIILSVVSKAPRIQACLTICLTIIEWIQTVNLTKWRVSKPVQRCRQDSQAIREEQEVHILKRWSCKLQRSLLWGHQFQGADIKTLRSI